MPFTPIHLGPGVALKALLGKHFSLMVFGFAQVVMDLEALVRIMRGDEVIHGYSHTYLGACGIAVLSVLVGRPVCQRLLDRWKPDGKSPLMDWLRGPRIVTGSAAVSGAIFGTLSHVFIDSIMHADMSPLAPFATGNGLLTLVSIDRLHLLLCAAGVVGMVGVLGRYALSDRSGRGQGENGV